MRETSIDGQAVSYDQSAESGRYEERYEDRYERSHDRMARMVAYLGPYIFWGTVGAICAGFVLLKGWL